MEDLFEYCLESVTYDYVSEGFKDVLKKAGTIASDAAKNAGNAIIKIINVIINTIRKCANGIANKFRKFRGKDTKEFQKKDVINYKFKTSSFKKKEAERIKRENDPVYKKRKELERRQNINNNSNEPKAKNMQDLINKYDIKNIIDLLYILSFDITSDVDTLIKIVKNGVRTGKIDFGDTRLYMDRDTSGYPYKLEKASAEEVESMMIIACKESGGAGNTRFDVAFNKLNTSLNNFKQLESALNTLDADSRKKVQQKTNIINQSVSKITADINRETDKLFRAYSEYKALK